MGGYDDARKAFPGPAIGTNVIDMGMTLRDYFAGQALGECVSHYYESIEQPSVTECAETAYKLADAMMEARKKEE